MQNKATMTQIPDQPQPVIATDGQPDDQVVTHLGHVIRKPVQFRDTELQRQCDSFYSKSCVIWHFINRKALLTGISDISQYKSSI